MADDEEWKNLPAVDKVEHKVRLCKTDIFGFKWGGGGSNSIFVHGHPIFGKCTCTKCTKCTKTVFSCLEVPWKDLLAVANSQ